MTGAPVQERPLYTLAYLRADTNGLTQIELARRAGLGDITVHNIENRKWASIELATAVKIFKALNVRRAELGMSPIKFAEISWPVPVQGSGDLPPL